MNATQKALRFTARESQKTSPFKEDRGFIDWLDLGFQPLVGWPEHVIADWRILRIVMSKRVVFEPLENNVRGFKHFVPLDPAKELFVDVQMLV